MNLFSSNKKSCKTNSFLKLGKIQSHWRNPKSTADFEIFCCRRIFETIFVLRSSSLARSSSDTPHALAGRIDCGWELPGRRPGRGLVRQWSRRKWWIQRPRQGRLIISYRGRSRAGFLPSGTTRAAAAAISAGSLLLSHRRRNKTSVVRFFQL